ncbi:MULTISPECIES: Fe2+-dependent dioxygenase [Alteromonadaceae]|uniref:Fe2+-dependent dioxygenase n=1 Tax=Alteromonadaceae TaxID=72275 RepID=UPI001C087AF9|nr:Fe2+-dependent dioxygenase [Aliiglaciecola lipolytica]MBU2877114.1 Fe2+-dependent dioxygenase [Aliiglaciecola lipolytica]
MVVIEQLLSQGEVNVYRQVLNELQWQDGGTTAKGMASSVKHNTQADPEDANVRQLVNSLLARMGETPELVSAALPQHIFPPCFNRYERQQQYGFHVDAAIMRIPNSQTVMRSDLSMTLFLSDPKEYEGGELIITTEFGEQAVKLQAGDAVLYPSSSLHKVTQVTKGVRLAAITWIQSMVADVSLRQSLYQLDRTIQVLMQNDTINRAELDSLHNVYHNLIRQNAQI